MANTNTVEYLKSIDFSHLTSKEKREILMRGRPTPDLKIQQEGMSHNKKYIRSFKAEWYQKISWLCGCESSNKLFCFPCLLFGGDIVWSQNGFSTIGRLRDKSETHEISFNHKNNVISMCFLKHELGESEATNSRLIGLYKDKRNELVKKNRNLLSKFIDAIKFCAEYGLPLRGHVESESLDNQILFRGLLHFQAKVNSKMKEELYCHSALKRTSTIQNDILQCILEVCQEQIAAEIKEAKFLALMTDDITDVNGQTQTIIVFRYSLCGTVYERFWGCFNPEDGTGESLSEYVLTQLKTVLEDDVHKLIAQTYDGACVAREVQKKIQDVYKNARYINSYVNHLNIIMEQVTSSIQAVRIFLLNISGVSTFFSQSPKRLKVLENHTPASIPLPSNTQRNIKIETANYVFENKDGLINCFTEMASLDKDRTFDEAKGYLALMKNEDFLFWLELFHKILSHVHVLYNKINSKDIDKAVIQEAVESFCDEIEIIRGSEEYMSASLTKISESKDVCDRITVECRDRFAFSSHLIASKLFYLDSFIEYRKTLPETHIIEACQMYSFIDKEKLTTELALLYCRKEFRNFKGLVPLLQLMNNSNLLEVFQETVKLLEVLITIPMTTAESDRCFSTFRAIKTHCKDTNRHLALSMLSIEKSMVSKIKDFNQKVIEKFCAKTNDIDYIFK